MNLRWLLSHARGYIELGMLREAEAELDAVEPGDAERPEVAAVRVALLHEAQDWPRLQVLTREWVERSPQEPGWWVSLAYATRRAKSLEEAREILLAAESHHADQAIIQFNLGCYEAQLGALEAARTRIRRAIMLNEHYRVIARHDPDLDPLREEDPGFPGPADRTVA